MATLNRNTKSQIAQIAERLDETIGDMATECYYDFLTAKEKKTHDTVDPDTKVFEKVLERGVDRAQRAIRDELKSQLG